MSGMQLRTVALVGGLGLTLGLALGGRVPGQSSDAAPARGSSGPRPLAVTPPASVSPLTEQLRLRLDQKPPAPRTDRNPFAFGGRRSAPALGRSAAASVATAPTEPAPEPAEPPPPGSEFRLTGMASTQGPDGVVWTAMVHDGQGLLYVQRGDALPGGFEVVDLQETSITLRDAGGGERTLRLR
jgi:hypothetical protein